MSALFAFAILCSDFEEGVSFGREIGQKGERPTVRPGQPAGSVKRSHEWLVPQEAETPLHIDPEPEFGFSTLSMNTGNVYPLLK